VLQGSSFPDLSTQLAPCIRTIATVVHPCGLPTLAGPDSSGVRSHFTSTYFSFALSHAWPREIYFFDGFLSLASLRTSGRRALRRLHRNGGQTVGVTDPVFCVYDDSPCGRSAPNAGAGSRPASFSHSGKVPGQRISKDFSRPNTTLPLDFSYQEFSRVQRPWIHR